MAEELLVGAPAAPEDAAPQRPHWALFMLPGVAQGFAAGKQLQSEEAALKLKKQELAGRRAAAELQQQLLTEKIAQAQKRKQWAGLYGEFVAREDELDEPTRAQFEGTLARDLAEAGEGELLKHLIEDRKARREMQQIRAIEGGGGVPGMLQPRTETPGVAPDPEAAAPGPLEGEEEEGEIPEPQSAAPALTLPPVTVQGTRIPAQVQGAFQRDQLRLAGLEQQQQAIEQRLRGLQRIAGTKRVDARLTATRQELRDVQQEIGVLRKRMAFTGSPIEQVTKVPSAYLTPEQVFSGGLALQQRAVERSRQQQASGLSAIAEKTYQTAMAKHRAELEAAPLPGEAAKQVGDLNTLVGFINEIGTLYQQGFVGKIEGFKGDVREFTGNIQQDEVQFRRLVEDVKDFLLRARSGAAITDSEYRRMLKLVPNIKDESPVFTGKLLGLGKAIEEIRDEKLRVATTPRKALIESSPRILPMPELETLPKPQAGPQAPAGFKILGVEEVK